MDAAHKALMIEEQKQRQFLDICEKAHPEDGREPAAAADLRDEVLKIEILHADTIKGFVEKIYEKAINDPEASQVLAEMCSLLPPHFEPMESADRPKERGAGSRSSSEKRIDFRLMLIKKAKLELEKGNEARKAVKAWETKEAAAGKEKLKADEKELLKIDRAASTRMLHAVSFCGYLYKAGILTDKVIHHYVEALLKDAEADPRAEDVESLTILLKLIGDKLDKTSRGSRDGKTVDQWFVRMQKIKEEAVSKQIAKMFDSVLTLRASNWGVIEAK